jgi:prophage regulatory protein
MVSLETVGHNAEKNGSMPRILRLTEVIDITGLGKTTIYQLQRAGDFPGGVKMTAQAVGWIEDEVRAWITDRMAARKGQKSGQQT